MNNKINYINDSNIIIYTYSNKMAEFLRAESFFVRNDLSFNLNLTSLLRVTHLESISQPYPIALYFKSMILLKKIISII